MGNNRPTKKHLAILGIISMLGLGLTACGGGGGSTTAIGTTGTTTASSASVIGTVPGTLIEAFCDNGSYYSVESDQNGTSQHPFNLELPADLGCRLVMTTNEGTSEEVVSPIGFMDVGNTLHTRLLLTDNTVIDLGYIPLPMSHAEAANNDVNGDGILDAPFILDNYQSQGTRNPLMQIDADNDGINDWQDSDHGGQQYASNITDPQDVDGDGVPNIYDDDFTPASDDTDEDGLPDHMDANPNNHPDSNYPIAGDLDGDGYHDGDMDHDGFDDQDTDHDGAPEVNTHQNGLQNANQGAILFASYYCATCHEADGSDLSANNPEAISAAVNTIADMAGIAPELTAQDYIPLAAYINRADHDADWSNEDNHGGFAEDNSASVCASCHGGPQLTGNGNIPSCYTCHNNEWGAAPQPLPPLPPPSTGNNAPVANAGNNQNVNSGATVNLDGSASSDADNDTITYIWTLAGTPASSTAALSDPYIATPSFIADLAGTYTLNLVVNDGLVNSISDTMTVTASDIPPINVAPMANAGNNQNVTTGNTVSLVGSGTDADNDQLTYSWTITSSPNGSAATLSDITVVAPTFTADLAGTYTVQLVVNDGTVNSNSSTVTITATAPAPPPNQGAYGQLIYDNNCSGCHVVGTYDSSGFAPDLNSKSSKVAGKFTADISSHKGITLSQVEIDAIATFLGP